jgi:membrane associated rhomboid family serine protease
MDENGGAREPRGKAGFCGILAGLAFLLLIGLPYWLLNIFSLSPCRDGPCDPNGAARMTNIAIVMSILASIVGIGVWLLLRRAHRRARHERRSRDER